MSMMITTSTPATTPAGLPQAAPATAAAAPATAFADWMGIDLSGLPQEAAAAEALPAELLAAADGAPAEPGAEGDARAADGGAGDQQQEQVQQLADALPAMAAMMPAMPIHIPLAPLGAAPLPQRAGAVAAAAPVLAAAAALPADAAPPAIQPVMPAMPAAAAPVFAAPGQAGAAAPAAPAAVAAAAAPAIAAAADVATVADAPAPVSASGVAPSQPALAAAAELKLPATAPAAWQQPLRDALGDRLQLQLSRNIDQAVIRLDPPNLGRIEIAIRHMAGALEVNISATHSEVVRQLNTISDTMRSDLAQRQFTEVAVNVTTATRNAAGSQQAFDQQGRQRQQDGAAEDTDPGRALAEAGNPSSTFSLNARESYA